MATNKKSFILYCDLIHTAKHLTDEQAGKLFKHILDYVNDKNPESNDPITNISFEPVKQQLKRDLVKYDTYIGKQKENGLKGGRPKKPKKPTGLIKNPVEPKKADSVNVSDNVTVTVNVNDIKKRKEEFKNSLTPFLELYSRELINDFISYWTEHGVRDKKMRFEKQKSFGLERRLSTWAKNNEKWASESGDISFSEKVLGKEKANSVLEMLKKNDIDNKQNLIQ